MSQSSPAPESDKKLSHKPDRNFRTIAILALILAIIALLLTRCDDLGNSAQPGPSITPTQCATPEPGATGPQGIPGADGKQGLSAYDLWIALGNTGTEQDFLDSLVGVQGKTGLNGRAVVYNGTDGLTGPKGETGAVGADGKPGEAGKSAYQLWLDQGNTGTSDDFLASLLGADGAAGADGVAGADGAPGVDGLNGLSAYELWLANGNEGTEQDFFDSLAGVPGTPGVDGTNGLDGISAYQIWLNSGQTGTEGEFLASLVGPAGVDGAPGVCTVGDTGATGATGASAYEVWLAQGNVGSEAVFIESLKGETGATGAKGDTGDTGATGPAGPPGTGGLGYYGSFYDLNNQSLVNSAPTAWTFSNVTGNTNGVQIVSNGTANTRIKFPAVGTYNIAFSTVFHKSNSNAGDVDIWFSENGVAIPDSNTRLTIAGQAQTIAAWNFFYDCTDVNDYVEVMWYTTEGGVISVMSNPASTSPARPAVPSIILTVNQVG